MANWNANFHQNVISCLTKLSHGSTPFITTFILIHLTAPAMAALGGSSLSSQTMLLGREYYQTDFGERYLVLGPLVVHAVAGVTKRLLSSENSPSRPLKTILSWTGYSAMLFFLPIHYMTHRVHPTTIDAPISTVGPSELDYEFVKTGLQNWPRTSWFLYAGLLISVAAHFTDGHVILWNLYLRKVAAGSRKLNRRIGIMVGLILPVLSGLYVVSQEPSIIFPSLAKRFQAVFTSCWVYRL